MCGLRQFSSHSPTAPPPGQNLQGSPSSLNRMYQGRPPACFNTAVFEQWSGLIGQQGTGCA